MDLLIDAALLQAFLLENVAAFKVPLLVTAQDRDQPGTENAAVRYTIVDGDPGGNFRYFKKKRLFHGAINEPYRSFKEPIEGSFCTRDSCLQRL